MLTVPTGRKFARGAAEPVPSGTSLRARAGSPAAQTVQPTGRCVIAATSTLTSATDTPGGDFSRGRINRSASIPFFALHLLPLLAIFTGVTWTSVWLCLALFWSRMFFITAGYHRYFAHRSFRTGRFFQFVLAFGGSAAAQKGPLWWAGHHRLHHRFSDTPADVHTPRKGFWWSHVGWILSDDTKAQPEQTMKEYADVPEIRFIDRHDWIAPWALGVTCFLIDGWSGLLIGFFLSTVLLWHSTFLINSLAHVWGSRRFDTTDTSRNNFWLALLTMGEGWHNNHHRYAHLARQGLMWWEVDMSYYVLCVLERFGIVWDLKRPRPEWLEARPAQRVVDLTEPD